MKIRNPRSILVLVNLFVGILMTVTQLNAQTDSATVEDGWVDERDEETGRLIRTKTLTLHPRAEPRPAMKHRFLPDDVQALSGNAAIYYLKALGFLEQEPRRDELTKFRRNAVSRAQQEGKDLNDVPPYVWLNTPPEDLPLEEVKEYLQFTSFQPPLLREAARRKRFDMDRNLPEVDDVLGYLLPEIQQMRQLARTQSLRCRVAIAEGRVDDAIEITGQQFALANHLDQDDFLVSNLVGIAIASIAWNDALYLVQHSDAPNLYWASTTMPSPLVNLRHAMALERQLLYQQIPILREVDQEPRPAEYWQEFIDRFPTQIGFLTLELPFGFSSIEGDPDQKRAALVSFIAAAYPGARDYLIERWNMPRKQVEAYPTAQVVFLAMVRYYDDGRDEAYKWTHLPFWQVRNKAIPDPAMHREAEKYGWFTLPARSLLPAAIAAQTAEARAEQSVALLQAVEAIRMYAAAHHKLPASLDELPVPPPIEPFTGEPVDYELIAPRAVLKGHKLPGMQYRLVLELAE